MEDGAVPVAQVFSDQGRGIAAAGELGRLRALFPHAEVFEQRREETVVAGPFGTERAGRDAARMAEDERDAHGLFKGVERPRVVAHAPHAVVAAAQALVGGVDDQGVVVEPAPTKGFDDGADAVVHAAHRGRVPADADRVVDDLAVLFEPGVHGFAREAGQLFIGVVFGVAVDVGVGHVLAQAVRTVVRHVQKERALVVLLQEVDGMGGDRVGVVARLGVDFTLPDGFVVVEPAGVSFGFGEPVLEPLLGMQAVAQVPLAAEAAGVAGIGHEPGEGGELADGAVRVRPELGVGLFAAQVGMHAVLRREQAGEVGGPVRRADRVDAVRVGEAHAGVGEAVDVGRADLWVAVAAQSPVGLVVGENENHVRLLHVRPPFSFFSRCSRIPRTSVCIRSIWPISLR